MSQHVCKIIAICNQKGGVGKTTTTISLGAGLVKKGKKVLLIDLDAQSNLTMSLGFPDPDEIKFTMFEVLESVISKRQLPESERYIFKTEGIDFVPSNIQLSTVETLLVNTMSRENKLKQFLDHFRNEYDYILIDCMPSLGMLTINALVAANSVIIPVQAHYLSAKGLELLLNTLSIVKNELNPQLNIEGILITMLDKRTNFAKDIVSVIHDTYGQYINIFESQIPVSIKAAETTAEGKSIFSYASSNHVAQAYKRLVEEVLRNGN